MAISVEPVLASSLWDHKAKTEDATKQKLATKCKAIDSAMNGGLDFGIIACISADADSGARDVTQALLVSHLSSSNEADATVIDTGQAVDVRRLYQALIAENGSDDDKKAKAKAKAALDRVKIVKPFDFEGMMEGVSELRDVLEGRIITEAAPRPPRGTVADSQEDEDEMLDAPTPPAKPAASTTAKCVKQPGRESRTHFLLIDNLTHLAAPLLKTNHASAQALITSFTRSLRHLATTHNICTLILNNTVPTQGPNYKEESPSAFASCAVRPALGKTWAYQVGVHLLLHRMPKADKDARVVYGGEGAGLEREMVSVLEVIQDRLSGRVGRWGAFTVGEEGKLKDV